MVVPPLAGATPFLSNASPSPTASAGSSIDLSQVAEPRFPRAFPDPGPVVPGSPVLRTPANTAAFQNLLALLEASFRG